LHRTTDVVDVSFEGELGCVHADDHELLHVFLCPCGDVWKSAQPVDAGIRPEVNEDDFPDETFRHQRWRIDPLDGTAEGGQLSWRAFVRFHTAEHAEVCCDGHRRSPEKTSAT